MTRNLGPIYLGHTGNVSDTWEHYPSVYGREPTALFARGQPLRLLEIGVQNGGSLQIWLDYLPSGSEVVGLEIDSAAADLDLGDEIPSTSSMPTIARRWTMHLAKPVSTS